MQLLSLVILAVPFMPFDKLTEMAMGRLIRGAYQSSLHTSRYRKMASIILDWNSSYIPTFTRRYIKDARNEFERTTAIAIACLMKSSNPSVAETAVWLLNSNKVDRGDKFTASTAFANHCGTMDLSAIKGVLQKLPTGLKARVSSSLITSINRFEAGRQMEILRLAFEINASDARDIASAILVMAPMNEQLFVEALKQAAEPHHKAILMLALFESDRKKFKHFEGEVQKFASRDRSSKWLYDNYKRIYLTDEWMPKEMREAMQKLRDRKK